MFRQEPSSRACRRARPFPSALRPSTDRAPSLPRTPFQPAICILSTSEAASRAFCRATSRRHARRAARCIRRRTRNRRPHQCASSIRSRETSLRSSAKTRRISAHAAQSRRPARGCSGCTAFCRCVSTRRRSPPPRRYRRCPFRLQEQSPPTALQTARAKRVRRRAACPSPPRAGRPSPRAFQAVRRVLSAPDMRLRRRRACPSVARIRTLAQARRHRRTARPRRRRSKRLCASPFPSSPRVRQTGSNRAS